MKLHQTRLFILGFFILLVLFTTSLFADKTSSIAGVYELTGVMEMAGALKLMPNLNYQAQFSYGAADWIEEGKWQLTGNNIIILSGSHFRAKNTNDLSLFLPAGTRFTYSQGKLNANIYDRQVTFINPNKTPSTQNARGQTVPGAGRMRIQGTVVKLDSEILEVKVKPRECMDFDVNSLSPEVIKTAKKSKQIDVEIPYSAIIAGSSC